MSRRARPHRAMGTISFGGANPGVMSRRTPKPLSGFVLGVADDLPVRASRGSCPVLLRLPEAVSLPVSGQGTLICHFACLPPGFRRRRGCALRSPESLGQELRLDSYRSSPFGCGVNLSPLGAESVSWSVRVATP